jgi:hypothetical protein
LIDEPARVAGFLFCSSFCTLRFPACASERLQRMALIRNGAVTALYSDQENTMSDHVIRVYDTLADAERARNALLAAGYPAEDVQMESTIDEANPTQGAFTVGNGDERPGGIIGAIDHAGGGDNHNYGSNYADTAWRSTIILTVRVDSDQRHAQAQAVLERAGMPPA